MSDEQICPPKECWKRRLARLGIVVAGIVLGQVILYGPSLAGRKVLLPLDYLAMSDVYLPRTPEMARIQPHDPVAMDLVLLMEPQRRFAAAENAAGRMAVWAPYHFAGAPFIWPKFSPFLALQSCTQSPEVLAWSGLAAALVAGLGAYVFFRRILAVGFWPATICAWCYPLTAFFIFWQGYATDLAVYWLPWLLLAVEGTARGGSRFAPVGLGIVTGLVLVSGHLDVAGQVLLGSGLYGMWCLVDAHRGNWFGRASRRALLTLAVSWALGFLLAAPQILPLLEYSRTGARMMHRSAGKEERPPVGLVSLPQVVLPLFYGSTETGSFPAFPAGETNLVESSAAAYAGLVATLFVAPLAFCSRRHLRINCFWALLALFGLSWCLNVPGFVHLLRLPGLNLMSHVRLTFLTAFAVLALACVGLEVLSRGIPQWRRWFWLPLGMLLGLGGWCCFRTAVLPEPMESKLVNVGVPLNSNRFEPDGDMVGRVQRWFVHQYTAGAVLCGLGLTGWCFLGSRRRGEHVPDKGEETSGEAVERVPAVLGPAWFLPTVGGVLIGELLWFGYGRNAQCDPALYYPSIPALEQVAKAEPGRIIGNECLPPALAAICRLRDIRGYDSVDPARMTELINTAAGPTPYTASYAVTQWLAPKTTPRPDGTLRLPPVLDMLGVRYVIYRGEPPPQTRPLFQSPDYWVLENRAALPRAFVPGRVEVVRDPKARLELLASPEFAPREVAYVEEPVTLPNSCEGNAEILKEMPTRIQLSVRMATPGLVVLADHWDQGWRAYLDDRPTPISRANHAVRGVVVPAGTGTLEFRYEPASFAWGLRCSVMAAAASLAWLGLACWSRRSPAPGSSHQL
jgi:hypothetical protein